MNNRVLGGIVAVVVIAVVVFLLTSNKSDENSDAESNTSGNQQQTNNATPPPAQEQPRSLKDLLAAGSASRTCTYTDGANSGTVYAANGKARVDMSTVQSGKTVTMHSIIDGSTYYSWTEGQNTGFMMTVDLTGSGAQADAQAQSEINKPVDYSCGSWAVDNSKLTPPTSVQFTDLSAMGVPGQ